MSLSPILISPLSIAPMIDWTYTHFRVFMRLLLPQALLYTEMQTTGAVFHNADRALLFHEMETPLALQLGGSHPEDLASCAELAEQRGFNEVNLNLGCPSDKVQAGQFGACLMAAPLKVTDCIRALKRATRLPVSAKIRIGIDQEDSYDFFRTFAHRLVDAGCDKLIVHARKAWLHGLNPKQNRSIPPLHYDYVYQLKQELPLIPMVINGNIMSLEESALHLTHVDGIMLGRLACQNPYALTGIYQMLYPNASVPTRTHILEAYLAYIRTQHCEGSSMSLLLKPMYSLLHGLPGVKSWKALLMNVQRSRDISALDGLLALCNKIEND